MRHILLSTASLAAVVAATVASVATAAAPVPARESLVVGRVERITLQPSGTPGCASPCAQPAAAGPDGTTRVCIANAGGCQQTEFRIERVLLGDDAVGPRTYRDRIGEWGGQTFPVARGPILVHVDGGTTHWAALSERDGKLVFPAAPLKRDVIGGVAIAGLQPDANGELALDDLLGRMHSAH